MTTPLTIVARLRAREGQSGALEAALLELTEETRREQGCLRYDLHVGVDDPDVFVFYETWTDRDAIDRHNASPHIEAFLERLPELVEEGPQVDVLRQVS